jgi:hypothetical protein
VTPEVERIVRERIEHPEEPTLPRVGTMGAIQERRPLPR